MEGVRASEGAGLIPGNMRPLQEVFEQGSDMMRGVFWEDSSGNTVQVGWEMLCGGV